MVRHLSQAHEHAVIAGRIAVLALTLLEAGWMTFDGMRALVVGDYVTPSTGAHAGQLGPWQYAVSAVGIAPRSTAMKLIFVIYGLSWLIVAVGFARGASWGWTAMVVAAAASLWYFPVGTLCSVVQLALLFGIRRTA
jgi:hypothetical protein